MSEKDKKAEDLNDFSDVPGTDDDISSVDDDMEIDLSSLSVVEYGEVKEDNVFLDEEADILYDGDSFELDGDIDAIDLEEEDEESGTLMDYQLNQMNENNDQTRKLAMLMGIDIETGDKSRGIIQDMTKYSVSQSVANSLEELEEEDSENPSIIKVPKEFTKTEVNQLKGMVSGILKFHKRRSMEEDAESTRVKLDENTKKWNQAEIDLLEAQNKSSETKHHFDTVYKKLIIFQKLQKGKKITKDEQAIISSDDVEVLVKNLQDYKREMKHYEHKTSKLAHIIATCKETETELMNEFHVNRDKNEKATADEIGGVISKVFGNMQKVVSVQVGVDMYSADFRETKVAVMCACEHVSIHEVSSLPFYMLGDIYNNFKERSYKNTNVTKNYFAQGGKIKQTETRLKLNREENIQECRIGIPGVTTEEGKALTCDKCGSYLFFTPSIFDLLTERGFIQDEFIMEYDNHGAAKSEEYKKQFRVTKTYLTDVDIHKSYRGDLGLAEYKIAKISSGIQDIDKYEKVDLNSIVHLDERALRDYAKVGPDTVIDLKQVEEEFLNHVSNIRLAIKELAKGKKPKKITKGMSKAEVIKQEGINKQREKFLSFLNENEGLLIKFAIDQRMSAKAFKNLIDDNKKELDKLKELLYQFLVTYLIDSVIKRKATFVFQEGSARTINHKEIVLPHTNFFDCYRELIRDFLLNEVRNTTKAVDLIRYYNIFKQISSFANVKDSKAKIRKSEEFLVEFRGTLGQYYLDNREEQFLKYISDYTKLSSNMDMNQKSFAWLYYEMRSMNQFVEGTELQDPELYNELYQ